MVPSDLPTALAKLGLDDYEIRGEEIKARCPSGEHPDYHPSWSINTESGAHHCFSCGFGGGFAELVRHVQGVDLDKALEWVFHLPLRTPVPVGPPPQQETLLSLAGFTLPPARFLSEKNLTEDACETYELLFGDMHWIAPARNPRTGQLWGYQKKSAVVKKFWFEPGDITAHKTLFGAHLIQPGGQVILVESPIDAVRIASVGIAGLVAVASYGVNITADQIRLLSKAAQVILALDNDQAGWKEAKRLCRCEKGQYRVPGLRGRTVFEYEGVDVKDPGEMTNSEILRGIDNAFNGMRLWQ